MKVISQIGLGFLGLLLLTGGFVNSYEKIVEADGTMTGVVSAVQENYISIVYSDANKGVQQEIGFERSPSVRLIHKHQWEEIQRGEDVEVSYVEVRREREGRTDTGEFKKESEVLEHRLTALEFKESKIRKLISGV